MVQFSKKSRHFQLFSFICSRLSHLISDTLDSYPSCFGFFSSSFCGLVRREECEKSHCASLLSLLDKLTPRLCRHRHSPSWLLQRQTWQPGFVKHNNSWHVAVGFYFPSLPSSRGTTRVTARMIRSCSESVLNGRRCASLSTRLTSDSAVSGYVVTRSAWHTESLLSPNEKPGLEEQVLYVNRVDRRRWV